MRDEYTLNNSENLLKAIKEDVITVQHLNFEFVIKNETISKFLILNNYYDLQQIGTFPISYFKHDWFCDYYFLLSGNYSELMILRLRELSQNLLKKKLNIHQIKKLIKFKATKEWEEHRLKNSNLYINVFEMIIKILNSEKDFLSSLMKLKVLKNIDEILDKNKYRQYDLFEDYHKTYHGNDFFNKMELLQFLRDKISRLCSLYLSISKERFIKNIVENVEQLYVKDFSLKNDNPIYQKQIVEAKQIALIKQKYLLKDKNLMNKINDLKEKFLTINYNHLNNKAKINKLIDLFINEIMNGNSSFFNIKNIQHPRYIEYLDYMKALKIINRLNSKNILFDGIEVNKYRHLISSVNENYFYNGDGFSVFEENILLELYDMNHLFNKILSNLIRLAKNIMISKDEFEEAKSVLSEKFPFEDEYYELDKKIFGKLKIDSLEKLFNIIYSNPKLILDDENYNILKHLLIESDFLTLSLIQEQRESGNLQFIVDKTSIEEILNSLDVFKMVLGNDSLVISNIDQIIAVKDIIKYTSFKDLIILGYDILKKIYYDNSYSCSSRNHRVKVATDLVAAMPSKGISTIPAIVISKNNYTCLNYDFHDVNVLTSGIDINSCFRICTHENDFFHYCTLDKNGIILKIIDNNNNFIGRVSGFRNGNGIYLNQLRTIYDNLVGYDEECDKIIEVLITYCEKVIITSYNNSNESQKIEFVVITRSYILNKLKSNVSKEVLNMIGFSPVDKNSKDWEKFIKYTQNLDNLNSFDTDYGMYSLICLASSIGNLEINKIKQGDVQECYQRKRSEVRVYKKNKFIERHINKINAIHSHILGCEFIYSKLSEGQKIILGDNWYIILEDDEVVSSCCLPNDLFSVYEHDKCKCDRLVKKRENFDKKNL